MGRARHRRHRQVGRRCPSGAQGRERRPGDPCRVAARHRRRSAVARGLGHDGDAQGHAARRGDRGVPSATCAVRHGHQRPGEGHAGPTHADAVAADHGSRHRHAGGARPWPCHPRRRLQRHQGRRRLSRRLPAGCRDGLRRQDPDPSQPGRALQRNLRAVGRRTGDGGQDRRRLQAGAGRRQGCGHGRWPHDREPACRAGRARARLGRGDQATAGRRMKPGSKTNAGNFFEDFKVGQEIKHATPRTLTEADAALNIGLYGSRFAVNSSDVFARSLGLARAPLDDLMVFHVVIGKTVPDISLNAVANLGYAEFRWGVPVYPGDTLQAHSTVLGLRENSNRASGVVWVRSTGVNQNGEMVLDYVRWVMVHKRSPDAPAGTPVVPKTAASVAPADLIVPAGLKLAAYDDVAAGSSDRWEDYEPGERIDHVSGITLEEADHMFSTRLSQNTARIHFDAYAGKNTRFGRRLAYGGHIISLARALSFNGLANGFRMAAINAGSHVGPTFGGDTIYAWSEILDKAPLPGRGELGALRVRTIAAKDCPCEGWPGKRPDDKYHPAVVLDLDYWLLIPR